MSGPSATTRSSASGTTARSDTLAADELELLRTTARAVLAGPVDGSTLAALGELGLIGLLVDAELGGAGWCPVEASVVASEVGRAAALGGAARAGDPAPGSCWLSAALAAAAVARADDSRLRDQWLPGLLDGTTPVLVATGSLDRGDDPARPTVAGTVSGVAAAAAAAPALVVLDEAGALLVELDRPGVAVGADAAGIDTTRAQSRVDLDGVPATPLGPGARPGLLDTARVLAAAELTGSLRAATERLAAYLSERVAFGAPVASFQAIQHRLVDLFLVETRAGVAVEAAARALAGAPAEADGAVTDDTGAARAAAVAHGYTAEHVPAALDECIQLSGGIGFTWEYPLHHELRRSVATAALAGSARRSRARLAALDGWSPSDG